MHRDPERLLDRENREIKDELIDQLYEMRLTREHQIEGCKQEIRGYEKDIMLIDQALKRHDPEDE